MSSKTKIVVLHLKELIYTGIFALLGILFIVLLIIMFVPKDKKENNAVEAPAPTYVPGIYTTSLVLNDNAVDVEVTVDGFAERNKDISGKGGRALADGRRKSVGFTTEYIMSGKSKDKSKSQ